MRKAALLPQVPPEGADQAGSQARCGSAQSTPISPQQLSRTVRQSGRAAPKEVGSQPSRVFLLSDQHHRGVRERMKPNFSKRTVKGQEVMGTNCSKRNSDYTSRKRQFFTALGPERRNLLLGHIQTQSDMAMNKFEVSSALGQRLPGVRSNCSFSSIHFSILYYLSIDERHSPAAAIATGTPETPIPNYLGWLVETSWCPQAHTTLCQQPGSSQGSPLRPAAAADSPNLDLLTLPDQ